MPAIVIDTDFLSSFLKIERLDLVKTFFQVESLLVPTAVYRELAVTDLLPALTALDWIQVREVDRARLTELAGNSEFSALGAGEQEAIALASLLTDSALLMSDRRAGHHARNLGVNVVNIPAFLLAYRNSGEASVEMIQELIEKLQEKDHYGFSEAVLVQLLTQDDTRGRSPA
jgi:predicted nucleic acid-binding protein